MIDKPFKLNINNTSFILQIDANGKFAPAVALKHAQMYTEGAEDKMKIAQEIIDSCAKLSVSDDHCEAAEEYCKCLHEQAMAHGVEDMDIQIYIWNCF